MNHILTVSTTANITDQSFEKIGTTSTDSISFDLLAGTGISNNHLSVHGNGNEGLAGDVLNVNLAVTAGPILGNYIGLIGGDRRDA